ncbi:hypothetical protein NBG4_390020 [Candidatus Sulfobium mesophilum]|uniref:Transposase IS200-like domain-containing protein n=1 Tax=Candidatus Sulfobium mesophilum TaxID=2016548 RepID=A0A2U3QHS0_9BACT|nr:hypothetical protein NBG4_390020 [Candidatus Sulfobium mesophilum]
MTVCAWQRGCLFGSVAGEMVNISDYGKIIVDVWNKLPERFQSVELDEFVIMPNHLHGIIKIVGADLCVCPYVEDEQTKKGRTRRFAPTTNGTMVQNHDNQRIYPRHQRTRMGTVQRQIVAAQLLRTRYP